MIVSKKQINGLKRSRNSIMMIQIDIKRERKGVKTKVEDSLFTSRDFEGRKGE